MPTVMLDLEQGFEIFLVVALSGYEWQGSDVRFVIFYSFTV